ncbi:hypothetical protein [Nonomuraea wenchangensis]|uniref:Uncharacterized protein n=1 Tax=Nonomuraea wenchangensis TaxID=568860 RepID=A0A1I0ERM0_9ACTN|nr:hypothetical protein [Nonomuraea wenchangensis]SET48153.1 hypothetical protein SAMN05421811_103176 [Nonomuraea wenchangensis]
MLIRGLPPESATKTALRNQMGDSELSQASKSADPSQGQWSQAEMLLASLIDSVRWLVHVTVIANGGKGRSKPPDPVPRPGVKPKGGKSRKPLTLQQQEAVLARIRGAPLTGSWQQTKPGQVTHLPRNS